MNKYLFALTQEQRDLLEEWAHSRISDAVRKLGGLAGGGPAPVADAPQQAPVDDCYEAMCDTQGSFDSDGSSFLDENLQLALRNSVVPASPVLSSLAAFAPLGTGLPFIFRFLFAFPSGRTLDTFGSTLGLSTTFGFGFALMIDSC